MNPKDFKEFLNASATPSKALSDKIVGDIRTRLTPSLFVVFAKFGLVHVLSATLTLLFCPQLGIGPVFGTHGLMEVFMYLGPIGCAMACGAFFLGTSFFLIAALLKPEELKRVRRFEVIAITFFAAISYAFLMLGGEERDSFYFIFWLTGAVIGAYFAFAAGQWVRFRRFAGA